MLLLVVDYLQKITLAVIKRYVISIWVEKIADKHIDQFVIHQMFPAVSSVNVSSDIMAYEFHLLSSKQVLFITGISMMDR